MNYPGILCPHDSNSRSTPHCVELLSTNRGAAPNENLDSGQPLHRPLIPESAKRILHNVLASTSAIPVANSAHFIRPEFFPRPVRGIDPYFGCTKWVYSEWERLGLLKLVRIRKPGHIRSSKVLVPYDDVSILLRKLQSEGGNGHD